MPPTPATYRGRFAPSPTGELHPGSLLAAFASWLLARQAGGRWLVRVEDLDPAREVTGAARRQLETLSAFGLHADEDVLWQSQRSSLYQAALNRLFECDRAFHCHCSRTDLAVTAGVHRACVARPPRPDPAVRLRVPGDSVITFDDLIVGHYRQDVARCVGDFVLRRADSYWAYQLAVVVDDADQGITDVVRGADLLDSTPRQILLQQALGLPTPRYAHLPLMLGPDGRKLSKSDASQPVNRDYPLAGLRAAWLCLGQDPATLADCEHLPDLLARSVAAFVPALIPVQTAEAGLGMENGD